jgi:hypothetical protein
MHVQARPRTTRRPGPVRQAAAAAGVLVAVLTVVALGVWEWHWSDVDDTISASVAEHDPESGLGRLAGRWRRSDGGHILEVRAVDERGMLDAVSFEATAIEETRARAWRDGATTMLFVAVHDVDAPGSAYTLTYDRARDDLEGTYYDAVLQHEIPVVFSRVR